MHLDRRFTIIGVLLIVLSMTMATQYATTKVGYSYTLVHPSNADIRFIASDNSTDSIHILRVTGDNASGNRALTLRLGGNWTETMNKTYTAAFGIVNEEKFAVNITHINVSTYDSSADYMQIWLHADRTRDASLESPSRKSFVWDKGTRGKNSTTCSWQLAAGNGNSQNMDGTNTETRWNATSNVRYSLYNSDAVNGSSDFVWVQISIDIPSGASAGSYSGLVWVHFKAANT